MRRCCTANCAATHSRNASAEATFWNWRLKLRTWLTVNALARPPRARAATTAERVAFSTSLLLTFGSSISAANVLMAEPKTA